VFILDQREREKERDDRNERWGGGEMQKFHGRMLENNIQGNIGKNSSWKTNYI